MIRVVIADDHTLVRQGIRALLEKTKDIEVIGEAADGQEALELTERLAPDVLVIDIAMPRLNGIEAVRRLQKLHFKTHVVILSMHSDETLVRQSFRAGARGFLSKRSVSEELLLAVRAAGEGKGYLSPAISQYILEDFLSTPVTPKEASRLDRLTTREREVLQLIAEGNTNPLIAQKLQISEKTVEKHRGNLMAKLGVHDMAGLLRVAVQEKLVFLGG